MPQLRKVAQSRSDHLLINNWYQYFADLDTAAGWGWLGQPHDLFTGDGSGAIAISQALSLKSHVLNSKWLIVCRRWWITLTWVVKRYERRICILTLFNLCALALSTIAAVCSMCIISRGNAAMSELGAGCGNSLSLPPILSLYASRAFFTCAGAFYSECAFHRYYSAISTDAMYTCWAVLRYSCAAVLCCYLAVLLLLCIHRYRGSATFSHLLQIK